MVEAPRLLGASRVNERVSAEEWPLDHPFYCFTNSLCLCHLTAQSDPWGRGGREREAGGSRRTGVVGGFIVAEDECVEKRAANL